MVAWTVLAPGPSLKHSGQAEGPIVAVNNAVLADWPIDFWCCKDPPTQFDETMKGLFDYKRIKRLDDFLMWCPVDQTNFWIPKGFRVWPYSNINNDFCIENLGRVPNQVRMTDLTILAAITRCIGLGARKINLHGCDMKGVGYSEGLDPENRSKEQWEQRWQKEREIFDKALEIWDPVEIIRHT